MRSRVMLYSFPMASNVRISPFGESPKRSARTLRERSGNPESRSFVTDFGEIVSIEGIVDAQYIPCLTLYQVGGVVSMCIAQRYIDTRLQKGVEGSQSMSSERPAPPNILFPHENPKFEKYFSLMGNLLMISSPYG